MKQRLRMKLVQRKQRLRRAGCNHAVKDGLGVADDYRSKLLAIYSQHEALFKRLENASVERQ